MILRSNGSSQAQEDYPLSAVPLSDRRSLLSTSMVLLGFTFFTGTMFGGAKVGVSFKFTDMLWILLAGNLLLGLYSGLLGIVAQKSGLSTVLLAKHAFGEYGSKWVDFVLGFTQMGWYAWGTAVTVEILNQIAGLPTEYNWLFIIFFSALFSLTAFVGYRGLEILSNVAVPAMLILIVWSLTIATQDAGGLAGLMSIVPTEELGIGAAITLVFGTFASGGTQATNWSRYAKTPMAAFVASMAAFFFGNGLMSLAGAYGAMVYQKGDLVLVMAAQGLVFWGIILLLLNVWTTQDNTMYNFSVAGCTMFNSTRRRGFVIGGVVISTLLAFGGIYNLLVPYLVLLGTFIPPIGGVILADYWFRHRAGYPEKTNLKFNWAGVVAYVVAAVIAYYSPGIATLNGIVSAIVVYWLINKFAPQSGAAVGQKVA
jgi:cytosine permease